MRTAGSAILVNVPRGLSIRVAAIEVSIACVAAASRFYRRLSAAQSVREWDDRELNALRRPTMEALAPTLIAVRTPLDTLHEGDTQ